MLNIALLGLGRAGQFHLQSIRMASDIRVRHVVDTNESLVKEAAAEFTCEGAMDYRNALEDAAVNAVIVATPTHLHYEHIQAALGAGKAVFTEKPLGIDLKEIDDCYAAADKRKLPLFLGFMRRFDPSFSSLADRVHEGDIGRVQIIRTTSRDSPLPSMDYIRTSHGIFHDCIVHDLDMIRFITREDPCEVYAVGSNFIPDIKAENDLDTVMVSLKFPSGILGSIDVSRKSVYGYDQRVEVFGTGGMLQAENRAPTSTVWSTEKGLTRPTIEHSFPTRYKEAYLKELESFRDVVLRNKPVPISHDDARKNFILADATERAFREAKPVILTF